MMKTKYSSDFFARQSPDSTRSASVVVPLIINLVKPKSVVDVGCGTGEWLAAFRKRGTKDVLGIDGDYVNRTQLAIPTTQFVAHDLTKPFRQKRTYDLVVSLEVGEHLPKTRAVQFVQELTNLGSVVLFSAAIPLQGGVHHINEQWQSYWQELFAKRGFVAVDCLRQKLWGNPKVTWWYAQNMMLYVKKTDLKRYPSLAHLPPSSLPANIVHPDCYLHVRETYPRSIRVLVGQLCTEVKKRIRL